MLTTVEMLEAVYGRPHERALRKEIAFLSDDYRAFVEASPFVVMSSVGPDGTDCSPKGDAPGFVRVIDTGTLAIPDRPGNNRIDNLRNIVADPRISLLFLVPGVGETLRVNGRATISDDAELLASFAVGGRNPRSVILVSIDAVYFHCSKAIVRSKLWEPDRHVERATLPSPGAIHERLSAGVFDGEAYDRDLAGRIASSLY
jgi:PPOX class probable FMN-dependent enzyme